MAAKRKRLTKAKRRERPGVYVGFRTPPSVKEQLQEAANLAGRSLSSEAQFRLEKSFEREGLLYDGLDLAYRKSIAGILLLLGDALRATSIQQALRSGVNLTLGGLVLSMGDEFLHAESRRQALLAAKLIIDGLGPAPRTVDGSSLGETVAASRLAWLQPGAPRGGRDHEEMMSRLAPLLNDKGNDPKQGEGKS